MAAAEASARPCGTVQSVRGSHPRRMDLLEDLHARYSAQLSGNIRIRWKYIQKKYLWKFVIGGSNLIKRSTDIAVCLAMGALLAPVFACVALLIYLTDRLILSWQARVGQWGQEFPFPKFRSMVTNAEALKDKLRPPTTTITASPSK